MPVFASRPRAIRLAGSLLALGVPAGAHAQLANNGFGAAAGGIDSRGGDVRVQVEQSFDPSVAPAPQSGVHVGGSLDAEVHISDNIRQTHAPRVADFTLDLTPTIVVTAETRRLTGNLAYFPTLQVYAKSSNLDSFGQAFNGYGTGVLVPDWLYLSGRAFAGLTSVTGQVQSSANVGGLNGYNRNDSGFSRSFEVSPYVRHDFAGYGTVNASYTGGYTSSNGFATSSAGAVAVDPNTQQILGLQRNDASLFTHQEAVDFSTGSYLGRINNEVRATGMQESGGGISDGAQRYGASDTVSYALFKFLSLSVTGGYEDISYPNSVPQVRVRDPVWGFGAKLIDGDKGVIAVSYGHHDGVDSPSVSAGYQVTPRFRVFGSYAEGLATSLEQFRGQVQGSGVDSFGRSISLVDNSPVTVQNTLFGGDTNVFRSKNVNFGASLLYSRDVFTLSVQRTDGRSVASTRSTPAVSQTSQYVTADWQHDLLDGLSMTVGVSYGGVSRSGAGVGAFAGAGSTRSIVGSVGVTYAMSDTVSLRAGYTLNILDGDRLSSGGIYGTGGGSVQNLVYVGIRKAFR